MVRKLQMDDYDSLVKLGQPYMIDKLRFSDDRARGALERVTSDASCYCMAEFEEQKMVGAVVMQCHHNTFYEKQHASLVLWLGKIDLLLSAVNWAMERPVVRCVSILFEQGARPGAYRLLERQGFENSFGHLIRWK